MVRSLNWHVWHWWSDDQSWDQVDASASKWSAMALGLNIRQPPAGFWLIPTYQPQHRLSLMRFIDHRSWEITWALIFLPKLLFGILVSPFLTKILSSTFKSQRSRWSCQNVWCDHNDVSRGSRVVSMIVTPSLDISSSSSSSGGRGSFLLLQLGAQEEEGNLVELGRELASRSKSTLVDIFQNVRVGCHNWWRTGHTWSNSSSNPRCGQ